MSLPVMIQGGHHLPGRVGVCEDSVLKSAITRIVAVIAAWSTVPIVVLPPFPRYVVGGCCNDNGHCENVCEPDHAEKMLASAAHLRSVLRGELTKAKLENVWVPDLLGALAPGGVPDISALFGADNVHLSEMGYARLADAILEGVKQSTIKLSTAEIVITGSKKSHYWRGFTSVRGSSRRATASCGSGKQQHGHRSERGLGHRASGGSGGGGGRGFHPYRGGKRRF